MTGEPFGRVSPVITWVAVGVVASLVSTAGTGVLELVCTGGSVGRTGVSVDVGANTAVRVRFGVGKTNGVGEDAPGNVQAPMKKTIKLSSVKRMSRYRICSLFLKLVWTSRAHSILLQNSVQMSEKEE